MNRIALRRTRLAAFTSASQASGGPEAISDLQAFRAREPESKRSYTVLKLTSASGLTGYGECRECTAGQIIHARQAVRGKPYTAYESMRIALRDQPEMEAAISMAMLDLMGKRAKAPVYQVLGGPTRNKVRALAALTGNTDDELAASLRQARAEGHLAFAVPAPATEWANHGKAYMLTARKRLDTLRGLAGDGCDFVLDGGGKLAPGDSQTLAAECERLRLLWFDEPCASLNLKVAAKISAETVTPVGFGRDAKSAREFQDLLREDAIDVVRPDIRSHGLSAIRRMAALAETYYVAVAPYHDGGPIATAAALHLAASLPNFFIQQLPVVSAADRKARTALTGANIEAVTNGYCALPTGTGLGINVNESALERIQA